MGGRVAGLLCALAVACAAVLLHAGSLEYELTGFDDTKLVLEDLAYNSNPSSWTAAFGDNFFDKYYRPLHRLTFVWDATRGGSDLAVYHRTNVALHALGAALVFAALRTLAVPLATAFVLGLGFAVHPLFASVVAWIPGRDNALATSFLLGALIAMVRSLDARGAGARALWLALHALAFAAALFTKEMAAVFPAVAAVYLLGCRDEPLWSRRHAALFGVWLGVGALWAWLRMRAMQGAAEWESVGVGALARSAPTLLDLVGRFVAPIRLNAFAQIDPLEAALGGAAWLALAFFVARSRRVRRGRVAFGVAWFGIFLAPTLVQYTSFYVFGEYRAYWLVFGLLVVLAEVLRVARVDFRRPLPLLCAGVALVALAGRSLAYAPVFDGELRFWSHIVEADPDSGWGWFHVGRARSRLGEAERAEQAYLKALDSGFQPVDLFVDLAALRIEREDWTGAASAASAALEIEPDNPFAAFNLAVAERRTGRCDAAIAALERALAPERRGVLERAEGGGAAFLGRAYDELGACYYEKGRKADAELAWASAISADPSHFGPYLKLIGRHLESGDLPGARALAAELGRRGGVLPDALRRRLEAARAARRAR